MIRTLPLLALLSACAPFADADITPRPLQTDASGYDLPQRCKAAPETVKVPVVERNPWEILSMNGRKVNAYYSPGLNMIVIDKNIYGWKRADTLKHEFFHAYCHATKDPCCVGHFAVPQ